jgi:hypothetical protein
MPLVTRDRQVPVKIIAERRARLKRLPAIIVRRTDANMAARPASLAEYISKMGKIRLALNDCRSAIGGIKASTA